MQTPP